MTDGAVAEIRRIANDPINLRLCNPGDNHCKGRLVYQLHGAADSLNAAGYTLDKRTEDIATRMARQTKDKIARAVFQIVAAGARERAAAFEARMRATSPAEAAASGWQP